MSNFGGCISTDNGNVSQLFQLFPTDHKEFSPWFSIIRFGFSRPKLFTSRLRSTQFGKKCPLRTCIFQISFKMTHLWGNQTMQMYDSFEGFDFMGCHSLNKVLLFGGVALGVPLDSHDERVGNSCNHGNPHYPNQTTPH